MSDKPDHRPTYYSGKKPYLVHNYRTMMKKKTQEEYYFHELHTDPMSELLRPYLDDPEVPGFTWEYEAPPIWGFQPLGYPGAWVGGGGPTSGPYDIDGVPGSEGCPSCKVVGPGSVECGDAWIGQVIPSQCAGFIQFGVGFDGESFPAAGNSAGVLIVAVPDDTAESKMIVCNSGGVTGVTCCTVVVIDCCCAEPTLSGPETTTKPGTAQWSVSPACPNASVACAGECTDIDVTLNAAGDTITASLGASACGAFSVTITDGCGVWGTVESNKCRITNSGGWDETTFQEVCEGQPEDCPGSICEGFNSKYCASNDTCYSYGYYCSGVAGQCEGAPCQPPCESGSSCASTVCWRSYDIITWTCDGVFGGWC